MRQDAYTHVLCMHKRLILLYSCAALHVRYMPKCQLQITASTGRTAAVLAVMTQQQHLKAAFQTTMSLLHDHFRPPTQT